MNSFAASSGVTDFAFFPGNWQVSHRRLTQRLVNSSDWEEFGGTCSVLTLLGGWAIWTTTSLTCRVRLIAR